MPYTTSTQKKYGENPMKKKSPIYKKSSGFKMKSSPAKIYSKPKGKRTEYYLAKKIYLFQSEVYFLTINHIQIKSTTKL